MSEHDFWMFAHRVALEVADINGRDSEMAAQVRGLSDVVREAKDAIAGASKRAHALRGAANNLADVFNQVDSMTKELNAAAAELQAEVGGLSNGGPPLESTGPGVTVDTAIKQVEQAEANK